MFVPIDQLVPHPLNSNFQTALVRAKLKAHLHATGKYPALVVRDVTNSRDYGHLYPKLQILDGQHRWEILRELGFNEVKVENWGALTDKQTAVLLASLNPLRGKDDPGKRATLLDVLRRQFNNDVAEVSRWVPESIEQIERRIETVAIPLISAKPTLPDTDETADGFDPYTVLLTDEMKRVVEAAVKLRLSKGELPGTSMDPEYHKSVIGDYQRGRALYDICAQYVLRETGEK